MFFELEPFAHLFMAGELENTVPGMSAAGARLEAGYQPFDQARHKFGSDDQRNSRPLDSVFLFDRMLLLQQRILITKDRRRCYPDSTAFLLHLVHSF